MNLNLMQRMVLTSIAILSLTACVPTRADITNDLEPIKVESKEVVSKDLQPVYVDTNTVSAPVVATEIKAKVRTTTEIKPKSNINPDPNVELIAPPTTLPRDSYEIPVVNNKENYVAQKAKGKNSKKVVKTNVKTSVSKQATSNTKNGKVVKSTTTTKVVAPKSKEVQKHVVKTNVAPKKEVKKTAK